MGMNANRVKHSACEITAVTVATKFAVMTFFDADAE